VRTSPAPKLISPQENMAKQFTPELVAIKIPQPTGLAGKIARTDLLVCKQVKIWPSKFRL
jgi:hypothetical protein